MFGKINNGDIVTNKKTFLYLKALELADDDDRKKLKYYFSRVFEDNDEKVQSVIEIYNKLNIDKVTESLIDKYYGIAIGCLQAIDVNDNDRKELGSIARNLDDRDH